jgi:cation diffusion facilitator family transporter
MNKSKTLVKASLVSTIGNAVLSICKITVGVVSGSLAVLGDGIDSATDVVSSVIMLFASKLIQRPPNRKYAFGYDKAESIATKVLSLIIFYAGMQMLISTIKNIFSPENREMPAMLAIYITIFSILGKLGLALYQFKQGKTTNSSMLIANAKNMRNDVLMSTGVLLGLIFIFVFNLPVLDAITGLIISLFVIKTSVEIFIDSNIELMDGVKDETVYKKIFEAVEQVPEAENPHRVRSRQIGGMFMIELDIEIDGDISLLKAHEISDNVEKKIKEYIDNVYDIVIHAEPKGVLHSEEKFGVDQNMV